MSSWLPQIIFLLLTGMGLGMLMMNHGKMSKPEEVNFWKGLMVEAIIFALLIWGGFFNGLVN